MYKNAVFLVPMLKQKVDVKCISFDVIIMQINAQYLFLILILAHDSLCDFDRDTYTHSVYFRSSCQQNLSELLWRKNEESIRF